MVMSKLRQFFTTLFGISSSEFSGFTWLIATALICISALFIVDRATHQPYSNYENDARILDSLLVVMGEEKKNLGADKTPIHYFKFDPNTVSQDKLSQLGFPVWLANRLINYRAKGGRFSQPKDLLKLYDFPDTLYAKLEPYVHINRTTDKSDVLQSEQVWAKPTGKKEKKLEPLPHFNLNDADTSMLQTIKGIGSVLSNRIVTYRNKLGGFVNSQQLNEVYNLDSATINTLLQTAYISPDFRPQQIAINSVNEKQLAAHPYITWKQAKLIVAYRNQHGNFNNKEALLNVYLINSEWLEKIEPYLSF